jgi:hypothetical protein
VSERGWGKWACTPTYPQQAGPKIPSPLNVRKINGHLQSTVLSILSYQRQRNHFFSVVSNNGTNCSLVLFTVVKNQRVQYLCKLKKIEMEKISSPKTTDCTEKLIHEKILLSKCHDKVPLGQYIACFSYDRISRGTQIYLTTFACIGVWFCRVF